MGRAAAMRQDGEPSVDEILASIKKVIARENRSDAAELRRRREREGVATARAVRDTPAQDRPEPADADEADDVLDLGDADLAGGECDALDDDPSAEGGVSDDAGGESLLGGEAEASIGGSLAALALLARPGATPQIVRSGETSLEGLARELLRPMLAEWLDTHLPPMVERMVAAEISRIAKQR